ncbi:MAG: hypothetical protein FJ291_20935 [Planctomycetes bacterium]|nr:hypothetical protein [Planctomycetota bacterium]
MSILHPLGVLALAAVPVLVALSLWRWRRREAVVSSLLLWREVAAAWRQAPHARRRRHADPLLLVRVAVALVLAGALCAPVWLRPSPRARRLAIVLDRSASMAALRPDGKSRWRACRDELLKLLVRLDAADRVDIVAVPPPANRTIPSELDGQAAASVLLSLEPSEAPVAPRELARAATDAASRHPGASVVVATDAPIEGLPPGASLLATGAPLDNLGITAFAARPVGGASVPREAQHEVLVTVANASARPASTTLVLLADTREVARRSVSLPPGGREPVIFDVRLAAASALEARLIGTDGLGADDRAWLARSARRTRIAWVGDESYFLRRALAVQEGVELVDLPGPPAEAVPRGFDLAVYHRAVPRALTRGSVVAVAPGAAVGGLRPGPPVAVGPASLTAPNDPLLAAVRLDGVALGSVPRPVLPAGFTTLVAVGGVPAIGRWREGEARLLYVGADPAAGDWALHPSFPIFWANVVAATAERGMESAGFASVRPGELVPVGTNGGVAVEEPGGARRPVAGGAFRPERTGLYRLVRGKVSQPIAVSLLSEGETLAPGAEARPASDPLGAQGETVGLAIAWRLEGWLALLTLALVLIHACLAAKLRV